VLVFFTVERAPTMRSATSPMPALAAVTMHLRNAALLAAFAIGFCILFAFIGTFSFVNFVLVREPLNLGMMALGFVYFVFLPSILTTPLAGRLVSHFGTRLALWSGLGTAALGLPLVLSSSIIAVVLGLGLIAIGTFFAQAVATGFVGRAAATARGAASGIYLSSYFSGGLIGTAVLGPVFDMVGWEACVAGVAGALAAAALLTIRLRLPA
jgi:predicted MFS family arabinose efflux permease